MCSSLLVVKSDQGFLVSIRLNLIIAFNHSFMPAIILYINSSWQSSPMLNLLLSLLKTTAHGCV